MNPTESTKGAVALATTFVTVVVDDDAPLLVRCHNKSRKLQIEGVAFENLSDKQFQAIADAIRIHLARKHVRQLREQASAATAGATSSGEAPKSEAPSPEVPE